ncbi:MAG: hypothetical protein K2P81_02475 [Bacteriovoracaceae bacterium]|nr:hypothetical protein [Bacteriovoracaceae bacterium]
MKLSLLLLLISLPVMATTESLRPNMTEVGKTVEKLLMQSNNPKDFSQSNEVLKELTYLQDLFKANKSHFEIRTSDWRLHHRILTDVVDQSKKTYVAKKYEVSRQMVKAIPALCFSCHVQDKKHALSFRKELPASANLLERAEFSMATRRPEQALLALNSYLNNGISNEEAIIHALRQRIQVSIWLERPWDQMQSDLKASSSKFAKLSQVQMNIKGWIEGIEKAKKAFVKPIDSVSQVPGFMKKNFGAEEPSLGLIATPSEEIIVLQLRQDLHNLMEKNPSKNDQPWILFWLAWSERGLNYSYFYSLADGYLKFCMDEYSKTSVAKKCYDEYSSFIEFAYSGSAGTDIPMDVQKELEGFKKKVGR